MAPFLRAAVAVSIVLAAGCSKGSSDPDTSADPDAGGLFTPPAADGGTLGTVTPLAECAEDTKDIYLITGERALYQFHPPTLEFKNKGTLDCGTSGATPTSMAVDRHGIAWVRYSDETLWKISTADLSCQQTKFVPTANTFSQYGMGFASETAGSQNEVLYLSDHDGNGLGKLDTDTLAFKYIGAYSDDLTGHTSELTGNGDGNLFGFFTGPAAFAQISKGTGATSNVVPLTGVDAGTAWAFSFYGGDFYVYTAPASPSGLPKDSTGSDVTRYRPSDGSITVVKSKLGYTIVGAGVSTCAPTTAPR